MEASIAILDYGMGNLRSVEKAFERVGALVSVTAEAERAAEADGVVLPGVGAFPKAMELVRERGFDRLIEERAGGGGPVLGICLGLQLLFSESAEGAGADGIGVIDGPVDALEANGHKLPHIGWSPVRWARPSPLTAGLGPEPPFYFVHTYAPRPASGDVLGTAAYGERFACAVERDPVYGVQFHPEKSSSAGLGLLANFVSICSP
ncbi:MAG: imidazole glycerol phosphate synthase subunit HisH [Solirubrobacterales bacterium]|nr:imidazole glycerol phosphate synthase subunit HisH [Solirubrobacterales bacterium]